MPIILTGSDTINYGTLKSTIATWLNRSDLTTYIPDFVRFAEQRIHYGGADPYKSPPLRIPAMQVRTTGTISSGRIDLPENMVEIQRISVSVGGVNGELNYVSPQAYAELSNSQATPTVYTFADNAILTAGTGSADYTLDYYEKFTGLLVDTDTNWLLTNAPTVYLYGALVETAPFLYDDPRFQMWIGMYRSAVAALNRSALRPAAGSLAVRVVK